MSDQQNQEHQSIPSMGPSTPPGYPPNAAFRQNPTAGMGYPPNTPTGAGIPPSAAFQPAQPFPPNGAYAPSSQLLAPPPRYQFHFSEKKMRRYFKLAPRVPLLCILLGILCLFISPVFLFLVFLPAFAGLTLLVIGMVWLIFKLVSRPNAQQYQGWLEERKRYLVSEARRKAFLENVAIESDQLFVFEGSVRPGTSTAKNYKEVYRKPSNYSQFNQFGAHYSINTYTIVFPIQDNVVVLSSEIDALNQAWTTTQVNYYYYEHVSGVQIADKALEMNAPQVTQARLRTQTFGLLIDNGKFVGSDSVVSMHIESVSGATATTIDADELIQRLLSQIKKHQKSRLAALRENEILSGRG